MQPSRRPGLANDRKRGLGTRARSEERCRMNSAISHELLMCGRERNTPDSVMKYLPSPTGPPWRTQRHGRSLACCNPGFKQRDASRRFEKLHHVHGAGFCRKRPGYREKQNAAGSQILIHVGLSHGVVHGFSGRLSALNPRSIPVPGLPNAHPWRFAGGGWPDFIKRRSDLQTMHSISQAFRWRIITVWRPLTGEIPETSVPRRKARHNPTSQRAPLHRGHR